MATLPELEQALINADKAGDMDAARKLAAVIMRAREDKANLIPGVQAPETTARPAPSIGQQAVGVAETGMALVTGAIGGTMGMIGGTAKGMAGSILDGTFGTPQAANLVEQEAMKGASALTYAPRTEAGQEMTQAAGEALSNLIPLAPMAAELGNIPAAARSAAPPIAQAARRAAAPVQKAVQPIVDRMAPKAPVVTEGSIGAAAVEAGNLRALKAEELGFTGESGLTAAQKSRRFDDVRFERETAKLPEVGEPLRERYANQQAKTAQLLDNWIDETGAQAPDLRAIGVTVDDALRARAAKDKTKIRTLYKEAEKAGEMEAPVALTSVAAFLTENAPEAAVANVLTFAKNKGLQLGVLAEDASGGLTALPASLKNIELFRRSINNATNAEPTNIKFAGDIKRLVDEGTAESGGAMYKQARRARMQYAKDYENISLVKQLVGKKRGMEDRAVALEHVLNKSVLEPSTSLDTLRHLRHLLHTEGDLGKQAWREIQGGTLQYIKDQALKSVATDQRGNRIVSPAQLDRVIMQLEKSGKLDCIFGKKGGEMLRTLNEVAKDLMTVPPGAVNTSNTATVLAGLADVALSGTSGIPAPVATSFRLISKHIKDAKLKAKVKQALGE